MEALILAGGSGTRLHPLTLNYPKSLIPLLDKPLIDYLLAQLALADIWNVTISLSEAMGSPLAKYLISLENSEKFKFHFVSEPTPLGTAGGIKYAVENSKTVSWPLLVFNADIISELLISDILKQHQLNSACVTIASYQVEDPERYGLLRVDNNRNITSFIEKPARNEVEPPYFINAGVYVLNREFIDLIPSNVNTSIERQTFPQALKSGLKLQHYPFKGIWYDVGTFASYHIATFAVVEQLYFGNALHLGGKRDHYDVFKDNIYIHHHSQLGQHVRLEWRVAVQKDCKIGNKCWLYNTILFPGVTIEDNVRLENCIIAPNVTVPANSYYANRVVFGAEPDEMLELKL